MIISWNNKRDAKSGMAVIDGNIASSYESFALSYFGSTSYNSWGVHNQAGVSVTQLHRQSAIGFRADKTGDQSRCTGGATVSNWNTHKTLLTPCVKSSSFNTVIEASITRGCCKTADVCFSSICCLYQFSIA